MGVISVQFLIDTLTREMPEMTTKSEYTLITMWNERKAL